MKLIGLFLFLLSIVINFLQIQSSAQNECCGRKIVTAPAEKVGVYDFVRVIEGEKHEKCGDSCVYSRHGFPDQEYCFKVVPAGSSNINRQCDAANPDIINEEPPKFACPNINTFIVQSAYNYTKTYSWEQCGNLCYLSEKCTYWSFWTQNPNSNCFLFDDDLKYASISYDAPNSFSGDRNCPVEDCLKHHYEGWWDVLSPCFKQRVDKEKITHPELCVKKPDNQYVEYINNEVNELRNAYNNPNNNIPRFPTVETDVPQDYRSFCPGNFEDMLTYLQLVATITPPYLVNSGDQLGVPIATMLVCYMHTTKGREFFANERVNSFMVKIVNKYGELLNSSVSLSVFNHLQYGWTSKCAQKFLKYPTFVLPDPSNMTTFGFQSFNDFFTRKIKDFETTRPLDENPKVLVAPGDVDWNWGKINVQLDADFETKNETYSLKNIFPANQISKAEYYVNGAIGSFFFSANKYHWFHAPVAGTIKMKERVEGIIYAIDRLNQNKYNKLNATKDDLLDKWIKYGARGLTFTQGYLAHVATRCIIEIETSNGNKIAMVLIGMTEISSCVWESDIGLEKTVEKGQALGHFQFGGSSGIVIIPPNLADSSIWDGIASSFIVRSKMIEFSSDP